MDDSKQAGASDQVHEEGILTSQGKFRVQIVCLVRYHLLELKWTSRALIGLHLKLRDDT